MFDRFTDRARKVMGYSRQEAERLSHWYIGTEHMLLGLVREGSGVAANVLENFDVDLDKVRAEIEKRVEPGSDAYTTGQLPFNEEAKRSLDYALDEARSLCHKYVGTEHILIGLLLEEEGHAADVLAALGLKLEAVRREVMELLGAEGRTSETGGTSSPERARPRILADEFWLAFDRQGWFGHLSIGHKELALRSLKPDLHAKVLSNFQEILPRLDDYATEAIGLIKSKANEEIASWGDPLWEYVDVTSLAEPGCFVLGFGFSRWRDGKGNVEFTSGNMGKFWIAGAGP